MGLVKVSETTSATCQVLRRGEGRRGQCRGRADAVLSSSRRWSASRRRDAQGRRSGATMASAGGGVEGRRLAGNGREGRARDVPRRKGQAEMKLGYKASVPW